MTVFVRGCTGQLSDALGLRLQPREHPRLARVLDHHCAVSHRRHVSHQRQREHARHFVLRHRGRPWAGARRKRHGKGHGKGSAHGSVKRRSRVSQLSGLTEPVVVEGRPLGRRDREGGGWRGQLAAGVGGAGSRRRRGGGLRRRAQQVRDLRQALHLRRQGRCEAGGGNDTTAAARAQPQQPAPRAQVPAGRIGRFDDDGAGVVVDLPLP